MEINPRNYINRFPDNNIHYTAIIHDNVELGTGNIIGAYAVIGSPGEGKKEYPNKKGKVIIGDNNLINEHVTIHSSYTEGGNTLIGSNCFIMTKSHLGHDVEVGDNVTISSGANVGGFVVIYDWANIGLNATIHQRRRIGMGAMVGMGSIVTKDVVNWSLVRNNDYAVPKKMNVHAIDRSGYDGEKAKYEFQCNKCG